MTPFSLVGDAPRYVQEIDISVVTPPGNVDEGIAPIMRSGELSQLDWTGIRQVEVDWREPGDGTWTRQIFYRGAQWMNRNSRFEVVPMDANGHLTGDPLTVNAGRDDVAKPTDDAFVRRFIVRQTATGCPARDDCSGASYSVQALVQLRDALHGADQAKAIAADTAALKLVWSQDYVNQRTVAVSHAQPGDFPWGYGFSIALDPVTKPANGSYYVPGDQLQFRVSFLDGQGKRLHPAGSLPTYGQFLRGEIASGLRYYDGFRLSPTVYYALKHRESNIIASLSGPSDKVNPGNTVAGAETLFSPNPVIATVANDGFTGLMHGVPDFYLSFGGLGDPSLWEAPVSDVVTFTLPKDAEPGTYVAAIKARREFGGEALNRATTVDVQVGTAAKSTFLTSANKCGTCHSGASGFTSVLHGVTDRRACYACHMKLSFEPDSPVATRIHTIHDRSKRFPADFSNCLVCHTTTPSGPAVGALPKSDGL